MNNVPVLNSTYGLFSDFIVVTDGVVNLTLTANNRTFSSTANVSSGHHVSVALYNPVVGSHNGFVKNYYSLKIIRFGPKSICVDTKFHHPIRL